MITLVTGEQDCGKSAFAERLAVGDDHGRRYYIATMKVVDKESERRREKHQTMRKDLDFETLEIPCRIDAAPDLMRDPKKCVVLLECIANLVANEMHASGWEDRIKDPEDESADEFVTYIVGSVKDLADAVGHLIVVTSEYPTEDETYDDETKIYTALLKRVNNRLKRVAGKVYTGEDIRGEKK